MKPVLIDTETGTTLDCGSLFVVDLEDPKAALEYSALIDTGFPEREVADFALLYGDVLDVENLKADKVLSEELLAEYRKEVRILEDIIAQYTLRVAILEVRLDEKENEA